MKKHILAFTAFLILLCVTGVFLTPQRVSAKWIGKEDDPRITGNCGQDEYWWQIMPDLVIDEIYCDHDNRVMVTITVSNRIGSVSWEAIAEIFYNDTKMGVFDIQNPDQVEGSGIGINGGTSTFVLPWRIKKQATVKVLIPLRLKTVPLGLSEPSYAEWYDYITKQELIEPQNKATTSPLIVIIILAGIGIIYISLQGYCLRRPRLEARHCSVNLPKNER